MADNRDKALKLFEESDKAYKSGKFEKATKLLRDAYALYPEPILLYNLGRAQEGLGDVEGAVDSYERYLKDAKQVTDRGAIERRIATLKQQLADRAAEEQRRRDDEERHRREEEERKRQPPPPPPPVVDDRTQLEIYGPWGTMGAGGAVIATGIVFGVLASAKHDDAIAAPVQRDAVELQRGAQSYATIANVLFVVGTLAVLGGGAWEYYEWTLSPQTSVQVTPAGVALRW